jgi:hypothetical protein
MNTPLIQAPSSARAKRHFEALERKNCETSNDKTLLAVKCWFDCFRKRGVWHNIRVKGKATGAETEEENDFPRQLA